MKVLGVVACAFNSNAEEIGTGRVLSLMVSWPSERFCPKTQRGTYLRNDTSGYPLASPCPCTCTHRHGHTDTQTTHTHTVTTLLPILLCNGIHKLDLTFIEPFQNSDLFLMKFSLLVAALARFMKCLIKISNYRQVQLATVVYKQNWFSTQGLQLQGQCGLRTGCVCWESSFSLWTYCHGHYPRLM